MTKPSRLDIIEHVCESVGIRERKRNVQYLSREELIAVQTFIDLLSRKVRKEEEDEEEDRQG